MSEKWIIALDQGTSSFRACAIDAHGKIRAQKSLSISPDRPAKGISQYQASSLLEAQLSVLTGLLDEIGPQKAACLAICSQRSTVVLWEKNTGEALCPILTWEDGRAAQEAVVPLSQEQVHQQTGLFKTPYFSAPKIAWCLKNYPQAQQALNKGTLCVAPLASFLIWHLTSGQVFATDPTLAQRTLLWDLHTGQWSETLGQAFGVDLSTLPCISSTVGKYGNYCYKGVRIPILVCVADQQAAAFERHLAQGNTIINYGTGAFVLHHTGQQAVILPGMLSSVAATAAISQREFLLEGPIFAAGSVLQWLQTQGITFEWAQLDALCDSAKNPVRLLPALGGLGAPYWDYQVNVMTENINAQTKKADWLAGALQGIAGLVADIVYYLHSQGYPSTNITVSGGLSKSRYLLQTQANLLGKPLYVCPQTEATLLGSARLAAEALAWDTTNWKEEQSHAILPVLSSQQSNQIYKMWQSFVQQCRQK